VIAGIPEHLANHPSTFANVLVNDRGRDDLQEVGLECRGNSPGQKRLSCTGRTIQKDAFRRRYSDAYEEFGVEKWQLDDLNKILCLAA
jgi:hypothetical protein